MTCASYGVVADALLCSCKNASRDVHTPCHVHLAMSVQLLHDERLITKKDVWQLADPVSGHAMYCALL